MRFLLDGMLGKLARWLRMLGYEAEYMNDISDSDLLTMAKRDSLTLLTSDEELYRTAVARNIESFYVQGRTEPERLAALTERYGLSLQIDTSISRCPVCGWNIREVPKRDVEASVPAATFKVYRSFWVCTNPKCAKVYWHGSHWKRIEQTLESAKKILDNKKSARTKADSRTSQLRRRRDPRQTGTKGDR
jgi:uncharacterized protein with PIN domain